ncbi:lytic transglycosylase domain-containing protein [Candidatus Bipolaricaulota bacterium]|nr:lytic transglycosylase domain-containing protein [Candidatus Bipolaricaulota bacterium]
MAATLVLVSTAVLFPLRYEPSIDHWASEHGQLDPWLVAAVIHAESRFRPNAVSSAGAQGLMQIMPATGTWIAEQIGVDVPIGLEDPDTNIRLGTWYLSYLLDRYGGDLTTALAAYNAGPSAVDRWKASGESPYDETTTYVSRVLDRRQVYALLYGTPFLGSLLRTASTSL